MLEMLVSHKVKLSSVHLHSGKTSAPNPELGVKLKSKRETKLIFNYVSFIKVEGELERILGRESA